MDNRVLVALSGGVDSAVSTVLLRQSGFEPCGIHFVMHGADSDADSAAEAARRMGISLQVLNLTDEFDKTVIRYFVDAYKSGLTPNPCVFCNRNMKFAHLFATADKEGIDKVATGHYARIEKCGAEYLLKKSLNAAKDQSYVLYSLRREWLSRLMFPLGTLTKDEVRELAHGEALPNADKPDSQDICFIPDGNYTSFIEARCGHVKESGNFLDMKGNVIGRHDGILNYTIGQRRGLKTGFGERLYVISKNSADNTVTLGHNSDLFGKRLSASSVNILVGNTLPESMRVCAKVRYSMKEQPATVFFEGNKRMTVEFDEPQRAFTSGQSVVLYDGDTVIGGGIIE